MDSPGRPALERGAARFGTQPEAGLEDFNEALRLDPDLICGYIYRSAAKDFLDDLDGALADLTEAIERAPEIGSLRLLRGIALLARGRREDARRDFADGAREPSEQGADWYLARGLLASDQDSTDEALELLGRAAEQAGASPLPYLERGRILISLGRRDEAAVELDRAIKTAGWSLSNWVARTEARIARAALRSAEGDALGACEDIRRALKQFPRHLPGAEARIASLSADLAALGDLRANVPPREKSTPIPPGLPTGHSEWVSKAAQTFGPIPEGSFRVVCDPPEGAMYHHDFATLADARQYADDTASELAIPPTLTWILDEHLTVIDRGMHYAVRAARR